MIKNSFWLFLLLFPHLVSSQTYTSQNIAVQGVSNANDNWQPLGPNDNWPSTRGVDLVNMAVAPNGELYVVYLEILNSSKVTVKRFDGDRWEIVGMEGFSTGSAQNLDIEVSTNGIPYILYEDEVSGSTIVQYFDGTFWQVINNEGISSANNADMALSSSGIPYMIYANGDNSNEVTVKRFNEGVWELVGDSAIFSGGSRNLSIAISSNDIPFIVYTETFSSETIVQEFNGGSWEVVGGSGFSFSNFFDFTLSPTGLPYVVYSDGADNNKIKVQRFNTGSWELLEEPSLPIERIWDTDVAVSSEGTVYISYQDSFNGGVSVYGYISGEWQLIGRAGFGEEPIDQKDLILSHDGTPYIITREYPIMVTVRRFNGVDWEIVGDSGISEGFALYTKVVLSSEGIPFIAYADYSKNNYLEVKRFNGNLWETFGSPILDAFVFESLDMAFSADNVPFVVYSDRQSLGRAIVQRYNGSAWEIVGNELISSGTARNTNIALSEEGIPYIAYVDGANFERVTVQRFNGTTWEIVGEAGFSGREAIGTKIVLDSDGLPYVVYSGRTTPTTFTVIVQRFNGTSWEMVGDEPFSPQGGFLADIALDRNNIPYVAYSDGADTNRVTVKRFIEGTWEVVGDVGFTSEFANSKDIAIADDGTPVVLYQDAGNSFRASVQRFDGNTWTYVGEPGFSDGLVEFPSMAIDSQGKITVVYGSRFAYAKTIDIALSNESQRPFITTWKTDNPGPTSDDRIRIPTYPFEVYNYNVDWGDGTIDSGVTGNITHQYATPGTYTITITGVFPRIYFNDFDGTLNDSDKIVSIDQWGSGAWTSMNNAFTHCSNLEVLATDIPNLDNVTNLGAMFRFCESLEGNGSFENWDVSNITQFSNMFDGASLFNQDIGGWDISNATSLSFMFNGASSFNQDISGWDISNVEFMASMFSSASSFNQPIGVWDIGHITSLQAFFAGATAFNQDLSVWDVSNVTDMGGIFSGAESFNQDISNWDVSNVTSMNSMFPGAVSFNSPIQSWNVSAVTDMRAMFDGALSFNQPLNDWDVSNVEYITSMFVNAVAFNQPLDKWNLSKVVNMSGMFGNASSFNQDLSNWDMSQVNSIGGMFNGATSFDQNLGAWDVGNVTSMNFLFNGAGLSTENYDKTLTGWESLPTLQRDVRLEAGDSQYCESINARQNLIDNYGWLISDGGETPLCNEDNDGDGVLDHKDSCLNSLAGATVDENGCDIIPNDAIKVFVLTPSCVGSSDGEVEITMDISGYLLDVSIEGDAGSNQFEDVTSGTGFVINDLAVGSYTVIISIPEILFEQTYGITVNELGAVSGKRQVLDVGKRTASYTVSGSKNYTVSVNGETTTFQYDTTEAQTLVLEHLSGQNEIVISGASNCQGKITDSFFLGASISVFPTVTSDAFSVVTAYDVLDLGIYSLEGRLIRAEQLLEASLQNSEVDISTLPAGVYLVKMIAGGSEAKTVKIVKR